MRRRRRKKKPSWDKKRSCRRRKEKWPWVKREENVAVRAVQLELRGAQIKHSM